MAGKVANFWNVGFIRHSPRSHSARRDVGDAWNDAAQNLRDGGAVLLVPDPKLRKQAIPGTFTPVFWNV